MSLRLLSLLFMSSTEKLMSFPLKKVFVTLLTSSFSTFLFLFKLIFFCPWISIFFSSDLDSTFYWLSFKKFELPLTIGSFLLDLKSLKSNLKLFCCQRCESKFRRLFFFDITDITYFDSFEILFFYLDSFYRDGIIE